MEETIHSISDYIRDVVNCVEKEASRKKNNKWCSNIKSWDDILHSFYAGTLVTIGGMSAVGKTAFALNLVNEFAVKQKHPLLFFSLESTSSLWTTRLISQVTNIPISSLLNGNLSADYWNNFDQRLSLLKDAPIFLEAKKVNHIDKLCEVARKMKEEHDIHIIFVDYVQLLNAKDGYSDNRYLDLNYVTRKLKELAKELEVSIVILSQLNRHLKDDDGLEGKRPRISDLRDSGTIEEDSDLVIMVHRPEYYHIYQDERGNDLHGKVQLIVAKNRMGDLGECYVNFNPSTGLMTESSDEILGDGGNVNKKKDDSILPPPSANGTLPF